MVISITEFSSHIVTALYLVNILFAFTVIFLERKNPTSTLVWILVLFLLPAVGAVFYILLSQNLTRKKMFSSGYDHRNYDLLLSKEIDDLRTGKLTFNDPDEKIYRLYSSSPVNAEPSVQDNTVQVFFGRD
jgi:cardiolipin synthase